MFSPQIRAPYSYYSISHYMSHTSLHIKYDTKYNPHKQMFMYFILFRISGFTGLKLQSDC